MAGTTVAITGTLQHLNSAAFPEKTNHSSPVLLIMNHATQETNILILFLNRRSFFCHQHLHLMCFKRVSSKIYYYLTRLDKKVIMQDVMIAAWSRMSSPAMRKRRATIMMKEEIQKENVRRNKNFLSFSSFNSL